MSSSMYDNFRAPQYVDFSSNPDHYDDSFDSTMFFDSDLENESMRTVVGGTRISSGSSFNSSVSENDKTLTPSDSRKEVQGNTFLPTPGRYNYRHGVTSTPQSKIRFQNGTASKVQINVIPPTPDHSLISLKNDCLSSATPKSSKTESVDEKGLSHVKSSCIKPSTRRRSMSESHARPVCCDMNAEEILEGAMTALKLSERKSISTGANKMGNEFSPNEIFSKSVSQPLVKHIRPESGNQKKGKNRPKRKLSPPPKNVRDYSQQPEKFISMAEQIVRVQNQTPPRFRSLPRTGALKKVPPAIQVKGSLSESNSEESDSSRNAPSASVKALAEEQGAKTPDVKNVRKAEAGVKVARWPVQKVEPFQLTQYKKKEVVNNGVQEFKAKPYKIRMGKVAMQLGDKCQVEKVYIGNFGTPVSKQAKQYTKFEPFSFDQRDQEFIARKLARLKQKENHPDCNTCSHSTRRRSKSQGPELCKKGIKGNSNVYRARVPSVLYKEPFVPAKSNAMPTKPIGFQLSSEERAKKRAEFDKELKEKEEHHLRLIREHQEAQEREQAMKITKLRKELVHKARPVPAFQIFKPYPSNAHLTEPSTPTFMRRSQKSNSKDKLNQQQVNNFNDNNDDPMEG